MSPEAAVAWWYALLRTMTNYLRLDLNNAFSQSFNCMMMKLAKRREECGSKTLLHLKRHAKEMYDNLLASSSPTGGCTRPATLHLKVISKG